jgi:hypothetical protein
MIQRLPANDYLKPHARNILLLTFKLLEYENEDNVLVKPCLHKLWCFQFLSRLTDYARLSVQFCQALQLILRQEFSYLSVRFCAM